MRILFVTNNYKPYSGGVVSSIDATMHALRLQGHKVLLVTLDFLGKSVQQHNEEDVARLFCPIRFMYNNNHMALAWRPAAQLRSYVRAFQPDIIHVHHPFLLGKSGLEVARAFDIPCVFTYHTMYEEYVHYAPFPAVCSKPLVRHVVKQFCGSVDGIIAPSKSVEQHIRERGIITPIEVIPSAIRTMFFECTQKTDINRKIFFDLLVVSRFTQEKNIPFIFDVFQQLPDCVRLTLAGYGSQYVAMQHMAFNVLCLPSERVRFIHKPEHAELLELYQNADLFLFSSKTDTQGLVIAEALSQGLPVVALDGPGQKDSIINGQNGFIVDSALSAAHVIRMISQNSTLHQQLQKNARITAQRYSIDFHTTQLLSFYAQIQNSCYNL